MRRVAKHESSLSTRIRKVSYRQILLPQRLGPRAASQVWPAELRPSQRGAELKRELRQAIEPVKDCGIYGVKSADLEPIKAAIKRLEAETPLHNPTEHLSLLAGSWKVIFSTIKITGSRRVKLGLRDLVQIGSLTQEIDPASSIAINRVGFEVPVFGIKRGELVLKAGYRVASPTRVTITLEQATLVPERLQGVFEANFDLLLSVFNPAGFLDISYCDENFRCGRDDKGNLFVLERA